MRRLRLFLLLALAVLGSVGGCKKAAIPAAEVIAIPVTQMSSGPLDPIWNKAPEFVAKLIPQDLVEPRLTRPSTGEVRVQAIHNGSEIAFRLRWIDAGQDDRPGPARFVDACAVQLPAKSTANPPAPQMGELAGGVQIAYWRADWQASVNGRGDTIKDLYPNAEVTHYPFEAASLQKGSTAQKEMANRYAPAAAVGNRREGPRTSAVESLLAEGPGTLAPDPSVPVKGSGVRTQDGWAVVIVRPLPEGLAPRRRTSVAFAVWQGSNQEAGARKMRSGWAPLSVQERQP